MHAINQHRPATIRSKRVSFVVHWVSTSMLAEGLGLAILLLTIDPVLNFAKPRTVGISAPLVDALIVIALSFLMPGLASGWAQARLLAVHEPRIASRRWWVLTAAGTALGWLVAILPSTLLLTSEIEHANLTTSPTIPTGFSLPLLTIVALILGTLAGFAQASVQWTAIRRIAETPFRWIAGVAAARGLEALFVLLMLERTGWDTALPAHAFMVAIVCVLGSAVPALIQAIELLRLTRPRTNAS